MSAAWVTAATGFAVAFVTLAAIAGRWAWRILSRSRDFFDDWAGEPERTGVPARPGVMARLQTAEGLLAKVVAETMPNGGGSLRDVVHKTGSDVAEVRDIAARLAARLEQLERQRETRERTT